MDSTRHSSPRRGYEDIVGAVVDDDDGDTDADADADDDVILIYLMLMDGRRIFRKNMFARSSDRFCATNYEFLSFFGLPSPRVFSSQPRTRDAHVSLLDTST